MCQNYITEQRFSILPPLKRNSYKCVKPANLCYTAEWYTVPKWNLCCCGAQLLSTQRTELNTCQGRNKMLHHTLLCAMSKHMSEQMPRGLHPTYVRPTHEQHIRNCCHGGSEEKITREEAYHLTLVAISHQIGAHKQPRTNTVYRKDCVM